MSENLFWARQIAKKILERKKFFFIDKKTPKLKKMSIKSSSSLSGVLHIGRLSDVIRGEAVFRALKENHMGVEFIYVTEDMDPLRSVPKNVPPSFKDFIGMPVSDVADPKGCHKSYADHFKEIFLEDVSKFLLFNPKIFSMREEYKKGNFTEYVVTLLENIEQLRAIQNKFRKKPLESDWSPWKPICDNCGKIQTTVVTKVSKNKAEYFCRDYAFEKMVAKGCGHEGGSDLRKGNGKLVWKSEWAAQWKRWSVVSEGAGKEYNAPNSAWFVNGEICEKILDFPMPEPIFYEHLLIDGQKMSASVGNIVYPKEWLEVARPEALKLIYLKRLSKTRSFSWSDVPNIELELDRLAENFYSKKTADKKESDLFYFSTAANRKAVTMPVDYSLIASIVSLFPDNKSVIQKLLEMSHLSEKDLPKFLKPLEERINHARRWVEFFAPPGFKIGFLESADKKIISSIPKEAINLFSVISKKISEAKTAQDLQYSIFEVAKRSGVPASTVFKSLYLAILGKEKGPKFGTLVFAIGKDKIIKRLEQLV